MRLLPRLSEEDSSPFSSDERISRRLSWITGLRLVFLSLLLGALAFLQLRIDLENYPESQTIVFFTIGSAYGLAAIYAYVLRTGKHLRRLAEAQIVLDQLTWTAIVYVSGGATSGATSFYGLSCLIGAVLVGLRGAAIAGFSGIFAYLTLCVSFALGWLHPPEDQLNGSYVVTWDAMTYPVLVNLCGILIVTILAGYLAERLRLTGGALRDANDRALAAERLAMLGRIAAGLAHEIRNPLGSIAGSIEMLREAPGLNEDDRKLCDIIQRESGRLENLVSDMMDLARPRKPAPEPVDVVELARDVVALASRSDRSGSGDVAVRYEGPDAPVWAYCDSSQMRQVVWNLVRNAVQASGAGQTVRVVVEPVGEAIRLKVEDQGPGIPDASLSKIFDGFYTTRVTGAGIGLAVVRKIIDEHKPFGARVNVRSTSQGATFEVVLAPPKAENSGLSVVP